MSTRTLLTLTLAAFAAQACDSIPFIGGDSESADSASTEAAAPVPNTETPASPDVQPLPAESAPTPMPTPPAPQLSRSPDQLVGEMPWNPEHTGVVNPGMSSANVIATWGEPAQQRAQGNFTYLYFRNGCERSCGTFDFVILEGDQVIDAVVRGVGHNYSGVSSSPRNTPAVANATANQ